MSDNEQTVLPVPEGITVVSSKPPQLKRGPKTFDWPTIKKEYLDNKEISLKELAHKHGVSPLTVFTKSQEDGWAKLRRAVNIKLDTMAQELHLEAQQKANARHILIAKMLQKEAVEAIKKKKVTLRSAKTALEFITESVRIERDALGMAEQKPQIVNILAQQQGIIDKYKK